jgi:carbamoylphosphate synthase small subunit
MKLNENLNLVLKDIFLYDIEACHYTILKNLGYDMTGIPYDDKFERNKLIGQMMRDNPRLTSMLRSKTESTIDEYITLNSITENEIVIRQYDGLIITRFLRENKAGKIPLDLRKNFEIFISSVNRTRYIARDRSGKVSIKGVPFRYPEMDEIYSKICRIDFGSKSNIFKTLQKIKDELLQF